MRESFEKKGRKIEKKKKSRHDRPRGKQRSDRASIDRDARSR